MIKNIIFDADGTLLDTNYSYVELYHKAYRRFGWDIPRYRIHRLVGMGHDKAIPIVTSHAWYRKNRKVFENYAGSLYRRRYLKEARLFPSALELCKRLKRMGYTLALASSSPSKTVKHYLSLFKDGNIFSYVTTFCDIENSKPEPDAFLAVLNQGRLKKNETVVIGDSIWDMKAARQAGLRAIGFLSGGCFSKEELIKEGALEVYLDPAHFLKNLSASFISKTFSKK